MIETEVHDDHYGIDRCEHLVNADTTLMANEAETATSTKPVAVEAAATTNSLMVVTVTHNSEYERTVVEGPAAVAGKHPPTDGVRKEWHHREVSSKARVAAPLLLRERRSVNGKEMAVGHNGNFAPGFLATLMDWVITEVRIQQT